VCPVFAGLSEVFCIFTGRDYCFPEDIFWRMRCGVMPNEKLIVYLRLEQAGRFFSRKF